MKKKMIKYEVWQMPLKDKNKFLHYDWCKEKPSIRDYVMVYSGKTILLDGIEDTLEFIFYTLNNDWPEDYHAASLSVSDVVCIVFGRYRAWYYVDGFGFKKLDWKI